MSKVELTITPQIKRLAVVMMANPTRAWTPAELTVAVDFPVASQMHKFRQRRLIESVGDQGRDAPRTYRLVPPRFFRLTVQGRQVLGEVIDRLCLAKMSESQRIRAHGLARQIVDALPESVADRLVLTRENVIHMITESGEAYAVTITPR